MKPATGIAMLLIATAAVARKPEASPLSQKDRAAFASRLDDEVLARVRIVDAAEAPLARASSSCATAIAPIHVSAFRDASPVLVGLPSGRVLVSTGLLAAVERDSELASLLAHEAAHVAADEPMDRLVKAYGSERLRAIGRGEDADVLAGIAANVATGGLLTRHGALSEDRAEDAATAHGCGGGTAVVFRRALGERRARRVDRQAHPLPAVAREFPGAADASVTLLDELRRVAGPMP